MVAGGGGAGAAVVAGGGAGASVVGAGVVVGAAVVVVVASSQPSHTHSLACQGAGSPPKNPLVQENDPLTDFQPLQRFDGP